MNENEIIRYLKQNKEKGTSFNFMPEDVRLWCVTHKDESIFNVYYSDGWNIIRSGINCCYSGIYSLPDDYEPKSRFKPHWEEFEINENGHFYYDNIEFYYRDDAIFEKRYSLLFKGFGGWLFNDKIWCTNPHLTTHFDIGEGGLTDYVSKNEKCEPAIPKKIRFWRYAE